jgi:RNA polymerase sigma factor (sigma-70 family)
MYFVMATFERAADHELLAAVPARQGEAFAVFYRRYLPGVTAYLLRETGSPDLAADLAAEVFAAVLLGARRYHPHGTNSAAPWVFAIARNKLRESRRRGRAEDRARRRVRLERESLDDDDLERVEELAALGRGGILGMVDDLPDREQAAVRAHVLEDRTYADVARELRCSELVVRKGVSRGLARLRKRLTEQNG